MEGTLHLFALLLPHFLSGQNAKKGMFACQLGSVGAREQLQNTQPLIYMSLNKNSVCCVMPRSSKPPNTCK